MAGSIRQLASGRWQLRAPTSPDPVTGRRRTITETVAGSRRSAELRLAELVSRGRRGAGPATSAGTVADVLDAWSSLPRLALATRAKAAASIAHLPPGILRMRADRLTGRDLDQLYHHLALAGVGAPTVRNLHGVLGAAFGQAVKWGTVDRNPVPLATPPPAGRSRADGDVSDAAIAALVAAAAHDQQQALWLRLHLVTAARRSEVLALRWSSITDGPAGARVTIVGSLERDLERTVKATKTGVVRTVAIDAETLRLVRAWQQVQRSRALATGAGLDADPFLLSHDPASAVPWRPDGATQLFSRLCRRAGVTGVRLHDLRHAAASFLLASGLDVATVAAQLGHANPRTTLTVYAHVLEGRGRLASDALAGRLAGL